jgi:hypothetical protein
VLELPPLLELELGTMARLFDRVPDMAALDRELDLARPRAGT